MRLKTLITENCFADLFPSSAATGAVHNFAGLVSARFFLGMVEAVFCESPGAART